MSRTWIKAVIMMLFCAVAAVLVLQHSSPAHRLRALWPNVMSQLETAPVPSSHPPPPDEAIWRRMSGEDRLGDLRARVEPGLKVALARDGLSLGSPAFLRVFKESKEMEIWLQPAAATGTDRSFVLWKIHPIAVFSGFLGPKLKEGDLQAPEGFYSVTRNRLNPASQYHLAFNIGYPNEYDRFHQRTGSLIMVHGSNVSLGCFAMTDPVIEEIYLIVEWALHHGQDGVPVHVFPFRMKDERLARAATEASPWLPFWQNLKQGHDWFENNRVPPEVTLQAGNYAFAK